MELVQYKQTLRAMVDKGELALPKNVAPEAFQNAAIVAFTDNPKIAICTPESLFKSIRNIAAMGLVPDGKEAALVPFKSKVDGRYVDVAQAMPMVFGLIKRARNSAEVRDIRAHIVYQREFDEGRFDYVVGDEERLEHRPIMFGDRGDPIACYAIASLKDDTIVREFMSAEDVDKVRRAGASQKIFERGKPPKVSDEPLGIWKDWSEEMWKKTAIRRLCKRLSMSAEDLRVIQESEGDEFSGMQDVTPTRKSMADRIAERATQGTEDTSHDVPDAEVISTEDRITADPDDGFPGDDAWDEGVKAHAENIPYDRNPYEAGETADQGKANSWAGGWSGAEQAA